MSTLPANFINLQAEKLGVKKVIVVSEALLQSYGALKQAHPNISVSLAPAGMIRRTIYLFFTLLFAKIFNTKVVFFHECCYPTFDLLTKVVRPKGMYFPQVTMMGFEEVPYRDFPKGAFEKFLDLLKISDLFTYYRGSAVGSEGVDYAVSAKSYPDSIESHMPSFSRKVIDASKNDLQKKKRILFLVGKSMVGDVAQVEIYQELVSLSLAEDFGCYFKDHPNPKYRLNVDAHGSKILDPLVPVELIEDDFALVVGTSSSALLNFGARAVSLIDAIKEISPTDVAYLKAHFDKVDPQNSIKYVQNVKEFENIISGISVK